MSRRAAVNNFTFPEFNTLRMTCLLFKHLRRYEHLNTPHAENIDNVFDCLNVLYQIAVNVRILENGTFRFLVRDFGSFETFRDFAVRRNFPFSYQTVILGDFEVLVCIPSLLTSLNKTVNRGL